MYEPSPIEKRGSTPFLTDATARLSAANAEIFNLTNELKMAVETAEKTTVVIEKAKLYHDNILRIMSDIRKYSDRAESVVPSKDWPYPSYGELLFSI